MIDFCTTIYILQDLNLLRKWNKKQLNTDKSNNRKSISQLMGYKNSYKEILLYLKYITLHTILNKLFVIHVTNNK